MGRTKGGKVELNNCERALKYLYGTDCPKLGRGVTGNTPDFGSGVSRFESWRPSHFYFWLSAPSMRSKSEDGRQRANKAMGR